MELEIRDSRGKEWFWLDNEYLNGYARILGASCTVVYLSLCRHADNNTQQCFPSMKLIATENGISTKTVERATKKLEEWGIICVQRGKKEDGTQANNIYVLTAKKMWKSKPTDNKSHGSPTDKSNESRQTPRLHNKTHINKTHIVASATEQPLEVKEFNNKESVNNLLKDESRDIKILGYYFIRKGIVFSSQKELSQAIAVNRSMIKSFTKKNGMHPFDGIPSEKILKAMDYAKDKFPDWSLKVIMERCFEIGK